MLPDRETTLGRHSSLPLFDLGIVEFLDAAALHANEMIVMGPFIQLEYRFPGLEMMALQDPGVLELSEDPIDGGQSDIQSLAHEFAVHILGGEVAHLAALEELKDAQAGTGRFQAYRLQVVHVGRGDSPWNGSEFRYHKRLSPRRHP